MALEDPIGAALGARAALILAGRAARARLARQPRRLPRARAAGSGHTDAQRNCVSGIRPEGLPVEHAAELLEWLVAEALRRGITGVALKDERAALAAQAVSELP